jgi:hypothetical protein
VTVSNQRFRESFCDILWLENPAALAAYLNKSLQRIIAQS